MVRAIAWLWIVFAVMLFPATAQADGDPASDVLVSSEVFFPSTSPATAAHSKLLHAVTGASSRGDRIKVAVVQLPNDLGSLRSLFGRPTPYARFLGTELKFVYNGPLLVAMPQGLGFYDDGRPTKQAASVLAKLPNPGSSPDSLGRTAAKAVALLEAADLLHFTDVGAPQIHALAAAGRTGALLQLHYWGSDDSGRARITASVSRGSNVLATFGSRSESLSPAAISSFTWKVPAALTSIGPAKFCVRAIDAAGHRSKKSCAVVTFD